MKNFKLATILATTALLSILLARIGAGPVLSGQPANATSSRLAAHTSANLLAMVNAPDSGRRVHNEALAGLADTNTAFLD